MAKSWRILDLTQARGTITAEPGALVITADGAQPDRVAVDDIAMILLGTSFSITSTALYRLGENDTVVLLCNWRGIPYSVLSPWTTNSRSAARVIAQAALPQEKADLAWQHIIRAKIEGQAVTLGTVKPNLGKQMRKFAETVLPGDAGHVEAQAARYYWERVIGKGFRRDRNGDDRRNLLLNYGYTILHGYGLRAVNAAGLVGALGIKHHKHSNNNNLVSDLIEPFRPVVDYAVINLPPYSAIGKKETKQALAAACSVQFAPGLHSAEVELSLLASRFARYCLGELDHLEVPVWNPNA